MIKWEEQHCGVHQAPISAVVDLMPDLAELLSTFPENPDEFTWDIKVHMLMPRQYPCIPNWHCDFVPRQNGVKIPLPENLAPMYLWISGPPLTQFRDGYLEAGRWHMFTQKDEHRGTPSGDFCWRGFIRAAHKDIVKPKPNNWIRRHCQVYLDPKDYQW